MGYKCGNCGFDGSNKDAIIRHMVLVHDCVYEEGDPDMVTKSQKLMASADVQKLKDAMKGVI